MESNVSKREQAEIGAAAWIARRERDDWSPQDQRELRAWVDSDANHRVAWLRISTAWQQTERLKTLTTTSTKGSVPARDEIRPPFFDAPEKKVPAFTSGKSLFEKYRILAAAGVAVAILTATVKYFVPAEPVYRTEIGALQAVPLPDGSRVTLNTATKISVAVTQTERRINLDRGEAYFEVAKDASRPFIVSVGSKRVVAVGTQFSVRRDTNDIRVVVTEGAVRVEDAVQEPKSSGSRLLHAGNVARASSEGVLVQQKPVSEAEQVLSWRTGYLIFDQTPLADAAAEFNRYNVSQISIDDPSLGAIPVGGNFRAGNVDAFVRLIEKELSIISIRQGDRIILRKRASDYKIE